MDIDNVTTILPENVRQRIVQLKELTTLVQGILVSEDNTQVYVVNIKDATLTLQCPNASYASIIQFSGPHICQAIRQHPLGVNVNKIKLKIVPPTSNVSNSTPMKNHILLNISADAVSHIKNISMDIQNKKLQRSLNKLSQTMACRLKPDQKS